MSTIGAVGSAYLPMSVIGAAPVFASAAGLSSPGTWATISDPGEKPSLAA